LIIAAHNPPVSVGFTTHHDDVDVLATEHRDQLLRQGIELGGPRLLPERGAWVDVVLDELIIQYSLAGRRALS